jgi:hypothetical protein
MTQTGHTFHDKEYVRNSSVDISPLPSWSITMKLMNQLQHLTEDAVAENEDQSRTRYYALVLLGITRNDRRPLRGKPARIADIT